jgi:hypothetical protein
VFVGVENLLLVRCVFYGDLYPNRECYNEDTSEGLKMLMHVRKQFGYGRTVDYFAYRNCIGFVRLGDDEGPGCVVAVSNGIGLRRYGYYVLLIPDPFLLTLLDRTRHAIRMNVGRVCLLSIILLSLVDSDVTFLCFSNWQRRQHTGT